MAAKPVIAAFDFDETLVRINSLPDFLRWTSRGRDQLFFWRQLIALFPMLVLYAVAKINRQTAKERLLTRFIGGRSLKELERNAQTYTKRLDRKANKLALERLEWHQQQGHTVIIVSASCELWIEPWAKVHGFDAVIATKLITKNGVVTGKIDGLNCFGPEKAKRVLKAYPNRQKYTLYAYGDGKSDKQLFELADLVYKKRFS